MAKPKVVEPIRAFAPRSEKQAEYMAQLRRNDLVFGLGPAGTGKTYTAAHHGVTQIEIGKLERYVILRPTVGVEGEDLGALPGDLEEKLAPWAQACVTEITKVAGSDRLKRWTTEGRIEAVPIAYIRGRTFDHSFVHVCEAQNLTRAQAMVIVTRIGEGSRLVIEGDLNQSDLRCGGYLGTLLKVAERGAIPHAKTQFAADDVVRSEMVKRWVKAFAA